MFQKLKSISQELSILQTVSSNYKYGDMLEKERDKIRGMQTGALVAQ